MPPATDATLEVCGRTSAVSERLSSTSSVAGEAVRRHSFQRQLSVSNSKRVNSVGNINILYQQVLDLKA